MLRTLIRLITGYERDPELVRRAEEIMVQHTAEQEAYEASIAQYPLIPEWGREFPDRSKPYDGWPVPAGVLASMKAEFLDEFNEAWKVAPAVDSVDDVVVFNGDYRAETDRGEVIYEEDFRRDEGDREPGEWLARIIAIHERLEEGQSEQRCKRVVRFRGSTPSSYRLERPPSGMFHFIPPRKKHDTVLALHQRWALQYLAALRHIHSRGVILNAPVVEESVWLRADFSLVVAGFMAASCADLGIRAECWANSATLESPFEPKEVCLAKGDGDFEYQEHGQPRADLFNWACWVYELMTGCDSPIVDRETLWMWDGPEGYRLQEEKRDDEKAVRNGDFENWPILRDEELGPCLVKAWRGEYESADDALWDVRTVLKGCGRVLVDGEGEHDEIDGFDWEAEFVYDRTTMQISRNRNPKLSLA